MTAATPGRETSDAAVRELWHRHTVDQDPDARHGLILHYAAVVKFVAGRVGTGLPATVETQDLVSAGTFGLIDAVDKFDPERGVRFETYAATRIRGAILDELRRLDWVPRSVRTRARLVQQGLAELEHRLQRSPSEAELARHLDLTLEQLQAALAEVAAGGVVAFDDLTGGESGWSIGEILADPDAIDPARRVAAADLRRTLLETVRGLPERERRVVALYYFEAMTLGQIGEVLGVTESRVSQIHAKAVLSLRNRLTRAGVPRS